MIVAGSDHTKTAFENIDYRPFFLPYSYVECISISLRSRPVRTTIGSLDFSMGQKLDLDDNANVCDIAGMKHKW